MCKRWRITHTLYVSFDGLYIKLVRVYRHLRIDKMHKKKNRILKFQLGHVYIENVSKMSCFRNLRKENSSKILPSGLV